MLSSHEHAHMGGCGHVQPRGAPHLPHPCPACVVTCFPARKRVAGGALIKGMISGGAQAGLAAAVGWDRCMGRRACSPSCRPKRVSHYCTQGVPWAAHGLVAKVCVQPMIYVVLGRAFARLFKAVPSVSFGGDLRELRPVYTSHTRMQLGGGGASRAFASRAFGCGVPCRTRGLAAAALIG